MREKRYTVYLKGGGPKIEPDENPREAQIADEMMKELECPLSYNFMLDPVFVSSGKTFDRRFISLEIIRQRNLDPVGILFTPGTSVRMTDVLTPNLQMRSITAKFVEKYKDVKYRGHTWNNIRLSCQMYEEEQTPERLEERKREDEKIEETKRLFELRKHQAQERILRENERIIQEQQSVIQGQMLELNRLREREQARERLARQARERLELEKREHLAKEEEKNRQRQAAQIAAQEETARLEEIAQGNFYRERNPGRRRNR